MKKRLQLSFCALAAVGLASSGCTGLDSGVDYPDLDVDLDDYLVTPEGDPDPSVTLSEFKFGPKTCEGLDTSVVTQPINQEDLTRFFERINVKAAIRKAREDLYWYELEGEDGEMVRVRLAILPSATAAAADLHNSLLEHGPGWWGYRRGNLAVLMPKASLSTALEFSVRYRMACWGMFTYTGVDDTYVVAGGYGEI